MTIDLKTLKAMSDGAMIMAAQAEQMALFAAGMVEGTRQMAESMQSIVNDCARQLAERRAAENGGAMADPQTACDSAAQESMANVSSLDVASLPQNAAPGAFRPERGQTGQPDAGSCPAPSQGATGASTAPRTHAAAPQSNAATPQTPPLDLVTLREFVAERSTPENRAKIKAILTRYGVRKLTELKESQYEAVRNEVAAL